MQLVYLKSAVQKTLLFFYASNRFGWRRRYKPRRKLESQASRDQVAGARFIDKNPKIYLVAGKPIDNRFHAEIKADADYSYNVSNFHQFSLS